MKKILKIDWEKFQEFLRKELNFELSCEVVEDALLHYELKDVVEFEATVICQEKTLGAGKFINAKIPDNLDVRDGDKLLVLAVKQKEEKR